MPSDRSALSRFLGAEEIPRWFGLSLVLIYLVGLATVANVGIASTRADARHYHRRTTEYALTQLAGSLSRTALEENGANDRQQAFERALREYAQAMPARELDLVSSDNVVVASTAPSRVGTPASQVSPGAGDKAWTLSFPVITGASDAAGAKLQLVATIPKEIPASNQLAAQSGLFAIVLVVLGALFVTYRCVRQQLRGVAKIADRLETYGTSLAGDLSALRIADTTDAVIEPWNALIELAEDLRRAVEQSDADAELSKALRSAANDSLSEALNAVPDGIIHIRSENRFAFVNAAAARILGWGRDDYRTNTLSDGTSTAVGETVLAAVRKALRPTGQFEASTVTIEPTESRDVDETSYRVWILPLPRGQGDGECVVLIRDITQQLRADRAREEFVTQVTHELRTPLTNIRAYAETLSSGMFEDPKVVAECYNVITKETRRLSRLIEDILSVSQLEVGSMELAVDQVDLRVMLEESVRDVTGLADEKNIDVQLVLPAKLEPIRADRDKLAVVLNNLLGNAIKYTPPDGIVVVGCKAAEGETVITVKDNGIGIDPLDHGRIFERFQRGSDADAQAQTGTGIGLYTAREIVRRHGGEIELISSKGNGSTFLVRLPRAARRTDVAVPATA